MLTNRKLELIIAYHVNGGVCIKCSIIPIGSDLRSGAISQIMTVGLDMASDLVKDDNFTYESFREISDAASDLANTESFYELQQKVNSLKLWEIYIRPIVEA